MELRGYRIVSWHETLSIDPLHNDRQCGPGAPLYGSFRRHRANPYNLFTYFTVLLSPIFI